MDETFDPYSAWLRIPPEEQPPHYYRLLGIQPFQSDPQVISAAARRLEAQIEVFRAGRHSKDAELLLGEIAAARLCLLDPEKKEQYDQQLRRRLEAEIELLSLGSLAEDEDLTPKVRPAPAAAPPAGVAPADSSAVTAYLASRSPRARRWPMALAASALAVVAAGVLIFWLSRVHSHVPARPSRPRQAQQQAQTKDASRSRTQSPKPHGPAAKTPATPQASAPQAAAPQPAKADAAPAAPPPAPVAPQAEEPPALAPRADQGKEDAAVEPPEGPSDHAAEPAPESPASDTGRLLTDLIDPTYPDDIGPEGLKAQEAQADAAAGAARLAVPDKQSRQQAYEKIRDLFQREFAGAQTPQQKLTLAATLLDEMQKTPDDPTARFVLLQLACETAAAAGELPKTLEIVDRMRRDYDIDALKVKAYVLSKLIASLPAGPRSTVAGQQLLSALEQLADESLAEDNLAMANRFVELGVAAAGKAADDSLRQRAAMRQRQVQGLTARFALVKDALNRLAEDADDGNANLIAGRWYCFSVGDFSKGLPLLAKCADPVAAAMAKRDLACPEDCRKQVELADLWWELAAKQPELTKSRMQSRARFWYNQALPKLEGSEKIRVSQRLEGIAAAPAGPRSP